MTFRTRVVMLSAGAVAAAIVLACVLVYLLTARQLQSQLDASLHEKLTRGQPESVRVQTVSGARAKLLQLARQGKLAQLAQEARRFAREGKLAGAPVQLAGSSGATARFEQRSSKGAPGPAAGPVAAFEESSSPKALAPTGGTVRTQNTVVAAGQGAAPPISIPPLGRHEAFQLVLPAKGIGGAPGYAQLTQGGGGVLRSEEKGPPLPLTAAVRAVKAGRRPAFFTDVSIDGTRMRELVEREAPAGVWQVALPLAPNDTTLSHLRLVLAIVILGGIALAAALGLLIARGAVRPVRRLTRAAERVARTQDLGHRIRVGGEDELGRLSASFNTMLAALERSRLAQRQLVSDASHELRTPLTSIQANLDALALGAHLPQKARARVLANAQAQLQELAALVSDLVDLSKTEFEEIELEDVRLDRAAEGALARARLHAPRCRFELDTQPCLVRAAPARLDRAIANLLDNAVKWGPPEGPVEVRVADGAIEVRDRGPGIDPEDLPRVFDRFYRAPAARARPGSGLGLAIVRQVAEASGGSVHAANHPGGGAALTLELPTQPLDEADGAGVVAARPRRVMDQQPRPGWPPGELHEAPRGL